MFTGRCLAVNCRQVLYCTCLERYHYGTVHHKEEVEVEEDSEVNPGEDKNLIEVPQKGTPEKTQRPKKLTEIDAGIAEKLDIG